MLQIAVNNLIDNAIKYSPKESVVTIVLRRREGRIILTITDEGKGIDAIEKKRVFDKFYRLKNTRTGGTGLGLSIVKGFVEAHQGTVILENVPHGARFTLEIPAEVSFLNSLKNE